MQPRVVGSSLHVNDMWPGPWQVENGGAVFKVELEKS